MSRNPIYTAQTDANGEWYPDGPGYGFSYYSGMGYPHTRCATEAEAVRISKMMNEAYRAGVDAQVNVVKLALGL